MKFLTAIKTVGTKSKLRIKEKSPEILLVAGIAGIVTSTVMACRATRKVDEILDEHNEIMGRIKAAEESEEIEEYTQEDAKKDTLITYKETIFKFAKLYAPAVCLGVASLGCILTSHRIMKGRLLTTTALYNATNTAFSEYRKRVAEKLGADEERKLRYNITQENIEVVDEKGKKKTEKADVYDSNFPLERYSPYARFFDSSSPRWEKEAEYNLMFLNNQQNIANNQLQARGYLFLNDVYEALGIPKTEAGQRVGWVYDAQNPVGDNFVDFGIYDLRKSSNHDFVNGYEPVVLLDFNVDGDILSKAGLEYI